MNATPADQPAVERDCRLYLLVMLLLYFAVLLAGSFLMPLEDFWNQLRVPALDTFGDLLYITRDGERVLHGLPKTPGFFYPPACYWFAYLGLGERHNTATGILLSAVFFLSMLAAIGPVRRDHVAYYGALLCSPPVMLCVSRGNIDLFVFILLAAALSLTNTENRYQKAAGYLLILYAAMIKLYPIFAVAIAIREKRYRWLAIGAGVGVLFAAYLFLSRDDLREMFVLAPRPWHLSYGAPVLFNRLGLPDSTAGRIGGGLALLLFLLAILSVRRMVAEFQAEQNFKLLHAFRLGAIIFLGCFAVIQYNFIYRFVTLVLTVPQWLAWRRCGGRLGTVATVALVLIGVSFWSPRFVRNWWNLDQYSDWTLFALYAFAFLATLPMELKRPLFLSGPAIATAPMQSLASTRA